MPDATPAKALTLLPGGLAERPRIVLWTLAHPALPRPIAVNPTAPLALSASKIAALGAGFDGYPPLIYALASALADLGAPMGAAEQSTDEWAALAHRREPLRPKKEPQP